MTAILKVRDKQTGGFVSIPAIKGDKGDTPDINPIIDILRSGSTPEQIKAALIALGDGYRDLYTIASTLKTFLESADTADATINTWHEIETFLQGITDMQSLTSLLSQLETRITEAYTAKIDETVGSINRSLSEI